MQYPGALKRPAALVTLAAGSLVMLLLGLLPALAQGRFEEARALLEQGRAGEAWQIVEDLALDGDPAALLQAADMLERGLGTPADPALSVRYLGQAAGLGVVAAQRRFAQALLRGDGAGLVASEDAESAALDWLTRAHRAGDVEAGVDLGEMHLQGRGVARDVARGLDLIQAAADAGSVRAQQRLAAVYDRAQRGLADAAEKAWIERSADEGNANAQAQLAYLYGSGIGGVQQDRARSRELYEQAALQGHVDAQANLAYRFHTARGDKKQLEDAIAWYQEAAANGQPEAQNNLGLAYMLGESVERDPVRAAQWFEKAVAQGNAESENNLGLMLSRGEGITPDPQRAESLFESAASKGLPQAQTNLGYLYLDETRRNDPVQAARWFARAAAGGYAPALGNLGYLYQTGRGVALDYARALALYHRSAGGEYMYAQRNLGQTYHHALGTRQDLAEALRWYRKAEEQGDEVSARAIEQICAARLVPGCRGEVVVLLREEDGRIGKVLVQARDGSEVLLDSDYSTSRLGGAGSAVAVAAQRGDVEAIFADVLAEMPPEPVKLDLYFLDGSIELTPSSRARLPQILAQIRAELAQRETVEVDVVGHADRVGELQDNDLLSRRRAEMLRARIAGTGIAPEVLKSYWRGERAPRVKTADGVAEPRNRRVEVVIR
jgi:TPR repeat protein/outer membrane protein OmpA-like peptidoglycan-associated protein